MDNYNKIRLLIADDHDMVRFSLNLYFSTWEDIEVVGEAADGWEAVKQFQNLKPDVVLMDLIMPVMDGVTATKTIVQASPTARILVLTSGTDPDQWNAAKQAGAANCVLKTIQGDELAAAVRKTYYS